MNESPKRLRSIGGRRVILGILLLGVVAGVFGYFLVPGFIVSTLEKRPERLERTFTLLEQALKSYASDHEGALPPEAPLIDYRRRTDNLFESKAFGVATFQVEALTTPMAYIDRREITDPYAMPEQFVPPAYAILKSSGDQERQILLYSPGPNLIYDIRSTDLENGRSKERLAPILERRAYDPTNGASSGGDIFRLMEIPY